MTSGWISSGRITAAISIKARVGKSVQSGGREIGGRTQSVAFRCCKYASTNGLGLNGA